jgi:uncharacterized membrane protein
LINFGFIVGIGWFLYAKRKGQVKADGMLRQGLALASVFLLLNAANSIFSAPMVFEDEIFPMVICFAYLLVLYDIIEPKFKAR